VQTLGPAIRLHKGSSATITGNEFRGRPSSGVFADGIQLLASSADIIGNTFLDLRRFFIGTFFQAVNDPQRTSTIRIINNLMVIGEEEAYLRAVGTPAMQIVSSANTINHFVIVNNTISHIFGSIGFALQDQQSQAMVANTIAVGAERDVLAYSNANPDQGSRITIHHCLIGGDQTFDSVGHNGNVTGEPQFVDIDHGDFRLQQGSPAVDAGDNAAIQGFMTDLGGNPRITDGDNLGTATVDMVAFELQP
jgi:hypothetical protein